MVERFSVNFSENSSEADSGRLWGSRGKFKTMQVQLSNLLPSIIFIIWALLLHGLTQDILIWPVRFLFLPVCSIVHLTYSTLDIVHLTQSHESHELNSNSTLLLKCWRNDSTQLCRFLSKEVREKRGTLVVPLHAFPLSVWATFRRKFLIVTHKFTQLSKQIWLKWSFSYRRGRKLTARARPLSMSFATKF